eukprot:654077_1
MEECKETKLELQRLRALTLDPRHYLQWTASEVVDWIISIEDGKYAVYEENLRLLFASESVNGMALSQISKPDLKDWGIKNFVHRSNLYNQIQTLVNQQWCVAAKSNETQEAALESKKRKRDEKGNNNNTRQPPSKKQRQSS